MRRRARELAILTAALGVAVLPAASADESDPVVVLSRDGVHWSESLDTPLYDSAVRWVPGDVRTAQLWVRNEHPERGHLTVEVERVERDALIRTGSLEVSARAGNGPWSSIAAGGLQEILDDDDLASGDPVVIEIRVRMDDDAPNGTMVLSTDLDLRVTLSDAEVVAGAPGGPGDEGPGVSNDDRPGETEGAGGPFTLPATGSDVPPWLPPLGLLTLGSGAYLLARRRQEDEDRAALHCS